MRHLFIVNPVAGGADRTLEITAQVQSLLPNAAQYEVYTTRAPGDAVAKIRSDAELFDDLRVYSVGGDGTFHECVNGAVGLQNVAVAVYPSGTGNDFVRMFGDEAKRFSDLGELILGETRPIDLIECQGRYGVNTCSVGLDARIGTSITKYKHLPIVGGKMSYISSVVVNVIKGISEPMRVSYGDTHYDGQFTLGCVCNGQFYGGGFHPIPEADPCDGLLDFIMIKKISRLTLVGLIGKYSSGRHSELPSKFVSYYRGERIIMESDCEMLINMDGEMIFGKRAEFNVAKSAVNCIFPKNLAFFTTKQEHQRDKQSN